MKNLLLIVMLALGLSSTTMARNNSLEIATFTASAAGFHATSVLIQGEKEVLLVDAQFTLSDAHRLTAQILETGKELTTVFITHAHPDHYFGLEVLVKEFPELKIVATADVVAHMKELGPKKLATWKPIYGRNLTEKLFNATPVKGLEIEGHTVEILEFKGAEIEHTAVLHLPEQRTVIAGDLVYNGVHPWLAETNAKRRDTWIGILDQILALKPAVVIGGHKTPEASQGLAALKQTRAYIETFNRIIARNKTLDAAKAELLETYGDLALPVILDFSLQAVY